MGPRRRVKDVDDGAEEAREGLLAEGRDAEAALAWLGADGRGARGRVDQGEFAKVVALAENAEDLLVDATLGVALALGDLCAPTLDDVKVLADLALDDDLLALVVDFFLEGVGDLGALLGVEFLQDRHLAEEGL